MPLSFIIEPIVAGAAEVVSEFAATIFGETIFARWLRLKRKPYSEAYCDSFYCKQCPGMAKGKRSKSKWHVYRCQDCGSRWGVLKVKPWVRRERGRGGI